MDQQSGRGQADCQRQQGPHSSPGCHSYKTFWLRKGTFTRSILQCVFAVDLALASEIVMDSDFKLQCIFRGEDKQDCKNATQNMTCKCASLALRHNKQARSLQLDLHFLASKAEINTYGCRTVQARSSLTCRSKPI
jgi:hypothetical protein